MKTATFKVEGMRCERCAETIKRLLTAERGVRAASVSLKDGEARVLYDPASIGEEHITAVIEKPGYRVLGRG